MAVTCAAILCVRNEELHIRRTLSGFIDQGIEVAVIDHESTDGTVEICQEFLGKGLLFMDRLTWNGEYDQTVQLTAKARIVEKLRHDWIIHTDADEWLQSPIEGESLLEGIERITENRFNVINFEEFVFLPSHGQSTDLNRYEKQILSYYFYSHPNLKLNRAWKRIANLQNIKSGGHRLLGATVRIATESFILRHYMVLSHEHAVQKYVGRVFSEQDVAKNWHRRRINLTAEELVLPASNKLKTLSRWDSVNFDRSEPKKEPYWRW